MINERNSDKKERSAITLIDENSTVITGSVTYRRCGSLDVLIAQQLASITPAYSCILDLSSDARCIASG